MNTFSFMKRSSYRKISDNSNDSLLTVKNIRCFILLPVHFIIVQVNGYNVAKASHSEVIKLIKSSGPEIRLAVASRSKMNYSPQHSPQAQHSPWQSSQHSPQQSPESSPDTRIKQLLSKQASHSVLQYSNSSMAAILATPPRERSKSVGGQYIQLLNSL
jgi:hypothetical protein